MMTDKSKVTLDNLLNQAVYSIPDYQRGYSWEKEQVKELVDDISNIVHWGRDGFSGTIRQYMGTIIIHGTQQQQKYQTVYKPIWEIVDGQQRLITLSLYLAVILNRLKQTKNDYNDSVKQYLYCSSGTRIRLHDDSDNAFYLKLLKNGGRIDESTVNPISFTASRLLDAGLYLNEQASKLSDEELEKVYDIITSRIIFTTYEVEEFAEVGMTFELVNNRGKDLTVFELFKNYLLYWCYRNVLDQEKREELTGEINRTWKTVYENVNEVKASDTLVNQFLKYVYIIVSGNVSWDGYKSLKAYLPLRQSFDDLAQKKIGSLLFYLSSLSKHFKDIREDGGKEEMLSKRDKSVESLYLSAMNHSGCFDNFMPLLLVCRSLLWKRQISSSDYLLVLKYVECFAYRIYLIARYRIDFDRNVFYSMASELLSFADGNDTETVHAKIENIAFRIKMFASRAYSSDDFKSFLNAPYGWFEFKFLELKYTLFEYEKWLIEQRQPGYPIAIKWEDLDKGMTREHILPQTPTDYWLDRWDEKDIGVWINDIGNMLLTLDNSVYSNHPYPRKCRGEDENGNRVADKYYANSTLMQEREMVKYQEWTVDEVKKRHDELVEFILKRWSFD